jgi:hypothetical protein
MKAYSGFSSRVPIEEVGDAVGAIVEEVDADEDVVEVEDDEAPTRACQTRGRVGNEGTGRCCKYRACEGRNNHGPCASVRGTNR